MTDSINYAWRGGYHPPLDPRAAHGELERIRKAHGHLTPDVAISEAKRKRSPIHKAFNWDDGEAAHEYRKSQARNLFRSIVIVHEDADPEPAYVAVRVEMPEYKPLRIVVQDPDDFSTAVDMLEGKLAGAQRALSQVRNAAAGHRPRSKQTKLRLEALDYVDDSIVGAKERLAGIPS
eukprot:GHVR01026471.1.p1 GENE.GHVR01026471.1~~GHVR01026471.1.p1  ORF type:complete len:177 (+),score=29.08 GHVR01026471.1:399-929(+)